MLKLLLALPPLISMVHIFAAILLHFIGIEYSGSLLLLFTLPVAATVLIHIYVAIFDHSMTKSEHLGYALTHIPFSLTFSFLSILFFLPDTTPDASSSAAPVAPAALICKPPTDPQCLSRLIYVSEFDPERYREDGQ
ncbi:hypothetical protein [Ferrimonas gelatinilytica]|uniref:Uncharacterized protein n=1 Tax=Ferrimonas gelatinilytica TaxID=1255257 RepID=A0ABP9RUD3_9GAMM